ncbi:MAG TPA: carboxypeptidase-like regulatory domain-containing protein, partial [Candidatus Cloacimonas sp.]|nr:carboxypeptidase-like regulatory domain-containing protein [Candidatus Cloacimonas sp.]
MNTKYISGNTVLKTHSWIILSLIVLIFAFLCNSCSTKANKGTISGTVTLFNDIPDYYIENPMDFSGVTVALYKTAVLDTTLVRINQQYPQIGVQITQETEFDHRNFKPLKVTTTDAIGKFSFPSLTPGDYNIVIWK